MQEFDRSSCFRVDTARSLPLGSRERAFASLCLRLLWHRVFDPCPLLLERTAPDGGAVFEPFLVWASAQRLPMDWRLHGELLTWLTLEPPAGLTLDQALLTELLAALAARWAMTDTSPELGILVASSRLPGLGVVGWKPPSLEEGKRVVLIELEGARPVETAVGWLSLATPAALAALESDHPWTSVWPRADAPCESGAQNGL